jgi:hypothetical protein
MYIGCLHLSISLPVFTLLASSRLFDKDKGWFRRLSGHPSFFLVGCSCQ